MIGHGGITVVPGHCPSLIKVISDSDSPVKDPALGWHERGEGKVGAGVRGMSGFWTMRTPESMQSTKIGQPVIVLNRRSTRT